MYKEFKKWFFQKEYLHNNKKRSFFHEREVWWCSLGANVGDEEDGKGNDFARPVLVFKKFNNQIFWALPLTTKNKNNPFHATLILSDGLARMVILSQIRMIDSKRLQEKMGIISVENFGNIKKALINLIE